MSEESKEWVKNTGNKPVDDDVICEYECNNGVMISGMASDVIWSTGKPWSVKKYHIIEDQEQARATFTNTHMF